MPTITRPEPRYSYSESTRRYRDDVTGRFVKESAVRQSVDALCSSSADRMEALGRALQAQEIDLETWRTAMKAEIASVHMASAAAARGGWAQMSDADNGRAGGLIKAQYKYLNDFALDIQSGKQKLDGRFLQRCRMYGDAGHRTYEETRRAIERNAGMTEERRVLGPAEHCPTCLEQARLDWQPIGTLRKIGNSECRTRCRCHFEFRKR